MQDEESTVESLKSIVKKFRDERDWAQFHDPKNLAEAGTIEAGELLENFLWKTKEEIAEKWKSEEGYRRNITDELADVLGYVLQMSLTLGVDLSSALKEKYEKNALKYPVEKSKGRAVKYTDL